MNVLLINNHSILNSGDYAILLQTLRLLRQSFPDARIALSVNEPDSARAALPEYPVHGSLISWFTHVDHRRVYAATSLLKWMMYPVLLVLGALLYRMIGVMPRLYRDRCKHALLQEFAAADLIVACGGGYLYSVAPGEVRQFVLRILSCLLTLLLNKPLVLLPQSIGPLHHPLHRAAVRSIVRHAQLTFVRERRSLWLLHALSCDQRAMHAPDLAFGMPSAPAEQAKVLLDRLMPAELAPAFRVGITALDWGRQNRAFAQQQSYEQALLSCIDAITARNGVVLLFAQCCGPGVPEDDRLVNVRLRDRARHPNRVVLVDSISPPELLQAAYGCMDYFIGTRMHSVIMALNAGTPSLAIGYLHKTRGLFESLGIDSRCYDINTLTGEQLIAGFEQLRGAPEPPGVAPYLAHAQRVQRAIAALLRLEHL